MHLLCTYIKSPSSVLTYSLPPVYLHTVYLKCTYIQSTLQSVLTLYLQFIYLGLGDTLHLQTYDSGFSGEVWGLEFCATLTAFDY